LIQLLRQVIWHDLAPDVLAGMHGEIIDALLPFAIDPEYLQRLDSHLKKQGLLSTQPQIRDEDLASQLVWHAMHAGRHTTPLAVLIPFLDPHPGLDMRNGTAWLGAAVELWWADMPADPETIQYHEMDPDYRLIMLLQMAWRTSEHDPHSAVSIIGRAMTLAKSEGSPMEQSIRAIQGYLLCRNGSVAAGQQALQKAREDALFAGDPEAVAWSQLWLGRALVELAHQSGPEDIDVNDDNNAESQTYDPKNQLGSGIQALQQAARTAESGGAVLLHYEATQDCIAVTEGDQKAIAKQTLEEIRTTHGDPKQSWIPRWDRSRLKFRKKSRERK